MISTVVSFSNRQALAYHDWVHRLCLMGVLAQLGMHAPLEFVVFIIRALTGMALVCRQSLPHDITKAARSAVHPSAMAGNGKASNDTAATQTGKLILQSGVFTPIALSRVMISRSASLTLLCSTSICQPKSSQS